MEYKGDSLYMEEGRQMSSSPTMFYETKDEIYLETNEWADGKEDELFDLNVGFDASFSLKQKQTKKTSSKIRSKNVREIIPPPSPIPSRKNPHEVLTAGLPSHKNKPSPTRSFTQERKQQAAMYDDQIDFEQEPSSMRFVRKALGFTIKTPVKGSGKKEEEKKEEEKKEEEEEWMFPPLNNAIHSDKNKDPIQSLLETMHTVDDAIQYFAQHRSQTPIKFINLIPNPHLRPQDFNPYDLIVLHEHPYDGNQTKTTLSFPDVGGKREGVSNESKTCSSIKKESSHFYIMTSGSIVHSDPTQQDESMTLGEWLRCSRLFSVIRKIKYFKLYLYRKMFDVWKDNVRFKQFKRHQKKVREHLFLANPSFADTILSLHTNMFEISTIDMFSMESHKAYTLDAFSEDQHKKQEHLDEQLELYTHRSIDEVYELAKFTVRLASSSDDPRDKNFIDSLLSDEEKLKLKQSMNRNDVRREDTINNKKKKKKNKKNRTIKDDYSHDITRFNPETGKNHPLDSSTTTTSSSLNQGSLESTLGKEDNDHFSEGKNHSSSMKQARSSSLDEKVQSLVQQKEERLARKRLLKRTRLEQSLLPSFVRLGDHIIIEHLVSIFFHALYTLNQLLETKQASKKTGLFETTVQFDGNITVFSPTCTSIQSSIQEMIEQMVSKFDGVNRMLYIITQLTSRTVQGPSIASMIQQSSAFDRILGLINRKIDDDFDKVYQHAQTFDTVRPVYEFNETWDLDAFKQEQHSVLELKNLMDQLAEWARELEKLRNRPIGVLEVDSKKLKHNLIILRNEREEEIISFLKEKARKECSSLLEVYEQVSNRLDKIQEEKEQHEELDMSLLLEGLIKDEHTLFKETAHVDQLYALMRQYQINPSSQDLVVHSMLTEQHQEYKKRKKDMVKNHETKEDLDET